ncbi:MAG: 4Fe-4S dicluster domain-containing protein [Corallococcus sp.]|nr:4Fe-4S dicluster domain-containing protein [Bacillota bacterium]MCM1533967.1 4Fe-4S dicluster domain-containing protein [Corallococcus sp.]
MNAVLYYSNANECKRIASYLADRSGYELTEITSVCEREYENVILIFPVYCQNIPKTVAQQLVKLKAKYLAVIAAYGKMSYGNVLYEIQRQNRHRIVAAAYVPTKHAYLDEERFCNFALLNPVVDKLLNNPVETVIPKSPKNVFSNFAPEWRSRIGVKIIVNGDCDGCGICEQICPRNAIKRGKPDRKCARCARCVVNCHKKALTFKLSLPLKKYLSKQKNADPIIYV